MNATPATPLAHPVNDAAARLGIGRVKLYELLGTGTIQSFKVGAKRLIPESELQRFIGERMQKGQA